MNFKRHAGLLIIALFIITSCKKNHTPDPTPIQVVNDPNVDVYVAGTSSKGGAATYWKNGSPTYLDGDEANAIAVSGITVYVAGRSSDIDDNHFATYWKNTTRTQLPGVEGDALAIAVNGSDVYVAGASVNGAATYWKNGVSHLLNGSYFESKAYAIALKDTNVYIAGYTTDANNYYVPTLWKNGVPTYLPGKGKYSIAYSIFLSGNNVYIAGTSATTGGQNFFLHTANTKALYWKNGTLTVLADKSANSGASAIMVSGGNVFVGGYSDDATGNILATYWKNGKETTIPLLSQSSPVYSTTGIAVQGQDIYVSGETGNYPGYWVNGSPVQLDKANYPSGAAFADGIVVVPR